MNAKQTARQFKTKDDLLDFLALEADRPLRLDEVLLLLNSDRSSMTTTPLGGTGNQEIRLKVSPAIVAVLLVDREERLIAYGASVLQNDVGDGHVADTPLVFLPDPGSD